MKKIIVSDFTLTAISNGEETYSFREKLNIANLIDTLGIDQIELPKLNGSKDDEIINRTIASSVKNGAVKIAVGDSVQSVEKAWETVKGASNPVLQVAMPVSTAQMEYFYHLKAPAMQAKIEELVAKAKEYCQQVEVAFCDAFRAEEGFVTTLAKAVKEKGATAVCISDEAGIAFPEDYAKIVKEIKDACDIAVFVKPNDNLTMSACSAVSAIKAGADGVKVSVKGEYLTPAVLSDIMAVKGNELGVTCSIDKTVVKSISAKVSAFVEVEKAEDSETKTVTSLSEESTVKQVSAFVKELGYELGDEDLGKIYEEFKRLSAKKKVIGAKEMEAIIASTAMQVPSTYHLVTYVVNSGNVIPATANVTLEKNGEKISGVSTGDGPIDAAFHAIEQVIGYHYELDDFSVQAVTKGREAVGSSLIRLRANGKLYSGNGVSTDIVGACIRAYINALNKIVYEEK